MYKRQLPEGARLQLDPALTTGDLRAMDCTGPCLTVARALQRYGAYVIDHSGSSKVYLEDRGTAHWTPAISRTTVSPIPVSSFRVLPPEAPPGG